jgi:hypothetical protein
MHGPSFPVLAQGGPTALELAEAGGHAQVAALLSQERAGRPAAQEAKRAKPQAAMRVRTRRGLGRAGHVVVGVAAGVAAFATAIVRARR